MEVIVAIYNKLDEKSPYRSDIFSLFGTEDGLETGIIGSKAGKELKAIEWDWGINGLKKVCKFIFWNKNGSLKGFNRWYEDLREGNFQALAGYINRLLYVFKYKGLRISAFVAKVNNVEKRGSRIWFNFTPLKFVLLPPTFMVDYRNNFFSKGVEDFSKWESFTKEHPLDLVDPVPLKSVFSSASTLDQYHIVPVDYLDSWVEENTNPASKTKPIFVASVEDNKKLKEKNLHTNNEIFWSVFYQYIGRSQVKGSFSIVERGVTYSVTDIPVNSLAERNLVYYHEVGAPYVIFQALNDLYRRHDLQSSSPNKFLDVEFVSRNKFDITLGESVCLSRAVKINDVVSDYDGPFESTDYDYVLDLNPLGHKFKILFDLTSGLWYKGLGKPKSEYVEQWLNNLIRIPRNNENVVAIWHYGLERFETYEGKEIGQHIIETCGLSDDEFLYVKRDTKMEIRTGLKAIFVPLYDNNGEYFSLREELAHLTSNSGSGVFKTTVLYNVCKSLFGRLLNIEY